MAVGTGYSKVASSGLVFAYDSGDTYNSYKGEPTTNYYGNNFRDFTGTGYSPDGEWTANPTQFTKTYYPNLQTPIGPGATLIQESGVNGYHHLSRYGGVGESGEHSLSCYLYPLTTGITDFCIGLLGDGGNMIFFNLDNKTFSYGGGITNGNAIIQSVPGWPGWLRVGANFEGRAGGWVGSVGYSQYTSYTGTAGGKPCYITGMQYEYKTHPTQFTPSSRSTTNGLLDISGKSNTITLNNSYDNNAMFYFDGTDDYLDLTPASVQPGNEISVELVCAWNGSLQINSIIAGGTGGNQDLSLHLPWSDGNVYWDAGRPFNRIYKYAQPSEYLGNHHWVCTKNANTGMMYIYLDGNEWHSGGGQTSSIPSLAEVNIGRYNNGATRAYYYKGNVYVAKIYNTALTLAQVRDNYFHYKTRFNLP